MTVNVPEAVSGFRYKIRIAHVLSNSLGEKECQES
jgi:hypothetical protein